ncbi:MAG: phosphatase PAP2 family protein [Microbacterium pygmaeum]
MEPARRWSVSRDQAVLVGTGVVLIALASALGAIIFFRGYGYAVDIWWNSVLLEWVSPFMLAFSRAMNWLGGGWFGVFAVPVIGAILLLVARRPWSAAFFVTAEVVSAGTVQILKHLFGRARPEDILVISDYGSFPSGHVANAATIAATAVVLFPRLWVVLVGTAWVLLMALSRTYLHAHWLSDTLGGALVGVGVVLIIAAVYAGPLNRERARDPARARG